MLGGFHAKRGKEGIHGTTVVELSLQYVTSPNGLAAIDNVRPRNLVVCSTGVRRKKINQATELSTDERTRIQIVHVMIDGLMSTVFLLRQQYALGRFPQFGLS